MTTHALPDLVLVSVTAKAGPVEGAWVIITLGMTRKNPHKILAGPTDPDGQIIIGRDSMEAHIQRAIEDTPMDFVGVHAWDGSIRVEAMGRDRVGRAIEAIDMWEHLGSLGTEENLQSLREFEDLLQSIAGEELSVSASCTPPKAALLEVVGTRA
jgi:hypothetical protein